MDWTTIQNWFHNNPTDWIAILISITVGIFSFYQFAVNRSKSTKIESARLIMDLDKILHIEKYANISARLTDDLDKKENFKIIDIQDRDDIFNYLNELETISTFYLEKILTKKQMYELQGHQILTSLKVETIKQLIAEVRKRDNSQDLFRNLERTWEDMKEYQNKTLKKF